MNMACRIPLCPAPVRIAKHRLCSHHYNQWFAAGKPALATWRPKRGKQYTHRFTKRDPRDGGEFSTI